MNEIELKTFVKHYAIAALWAETAGDDEPLDSNYGIDDIEPETMERMKQDCEKFITENATLLTDIDTKQAAHDFWLTRNGHGAGFWDRGLGEVGEKLTEAANKYGCFDLFVNNGQVSAL